MKAAPHGSRKNAPVETAEKSKAGRAGSSEALLAEIRKSLADGWLPSLYRETILPRRTRAHEVYPAARGARVEVQHTLLGVELKVGRRRMLCPDLATARYLAVFARAGCARVAVPYDITQISHLADKLESAWQRMLLLVDHLTEGRTSAFRSRVRATIIGEVRREIEEAGAGSAVPQFNQNTKQRPRRA
ncbi:MAG: hypothetical protein ACRD68_07540 [Pyrinomonadaceae bacterium]